MRFVLLMTMLVTFAAFAEHDEEPPAPEGPRRVADPRLTLPPPAQDGPRVVADPRLKAPPSRQGLSRLVLGFHKFDGDFTSESYQNWATKNPKQAEALKTELTAEYLKGEKRPLTITPVATAGSSTVVLRVTTNDGATLGSFRMGSVGKEFGGGDGNYVLSFVQPAKDPRR